MAEACNTRVSEWVGAKGGVRGPNNGFQNGVQIIPTVPPSLGNACDLLTPDLTPMTFSFFPFFFPSFLIFMSDPLNF